MNPLSFVAPPFGSNQRPSPDSSVPVDFNGCPFDSDNDGVPDYQDLCPGTPPNTTVNSQGCPDTDGDGVPDNLDLCPGTPPNAQVNISGCQNCSPDTDGSGGSICSVGVITHTGTAAGLCNEDGSTGL